MNDRKMRRIIVDLAENTDYCVEGNSMRGNVIPAGIQLILSICFSSAVGGHMHAAMGVSKHREKGYGIVTITGHTH